MDALTGVCALRALDEAVHEAFAAWCEREGGSLRAWRVAFAVDCTFAVVAGPFDEPAARRVLGADVRCERPPALYLSVEPATQRGAALLEEALGGRGAPTGVQLERRARALLLRLATERTPYALVRDLIDLELISNGEACAVRLLSPVPLRTVAAIAATGLGADISPRDVLEAHL
ncbi:hypothetical protein EPN52_11305 [bacterium]|nr:MAG: hypothetical protein EPN52_11305 [bacterium]